MLAGGGCETSKPLLTSPSKGYVLSGVVTDAAASWPIIGATVRVSSGQMALAEVLTDGSGAYRLTGLPPGFVFLRISKDGYQTATPTAFIASSDTVTNVTLTPNNTGKRTPNIGEPIMSSVSADDPLCNTADPSYEDLQAPCRRFRFIAARSGALVADLTWNDVGIFMELLTPDLGSCCSSPLRLRFPVIADHAYELNVGFHGTTGAGPRGAAPFMLTTSLAPQ
jgi:hypothetical protein